MDVAQAQASNTGEEVVFDDPGWPYTIRVRMSPDTKRPVVRELTVTAREEHTSSPRSTPRHPPVTSTVLAQIPVRQLASVAASLLAGEGEAQYRMLASPRLPGKRDWPPDHLARVARVAAWARATGRAGGMSGTIAEFWGVHCRTARRWLALLRVEDQPATRTAPSPVPDPPAADAVPG